MNEQQQPRQNNTCLDVGQIIAWHDGALPPQEADAVRAHLTICARCTAEEQALRRESRQVFDLLSRLDPPPVANAEPAVANGVVYVGALGGNVYAFHLPKRDPSSNGTAHTLP